MGLTPIRFINGGDTTPPLRPERESDFTNIGGIVGWGLMTNESNDERRLIFPFSLEKKKLTIRRLADARDDAQRTGRLPPYKIPADKLVTKNFSRYSCFKIANRKVVCCCHFTFADLHKIEK